MSHRLFLDSIFSNACVWAVLKQVDEVEAARFCTARPTRANPAVWRLSFERTPGALAFAAPIAGDE